VIKVGQKATMTVKVSQTMYDKMTTYAQKEHMTQAEAMDAFFAEYIKTITILEGKNDELTKQIEKMKKENEQLQRELKDTKKEADEWEKRAMKNLKENLEKN
jgi:predicted RNase H-like nuclease (RuvC/YqgF family)